MTIPLLLLLTCSPPARALPAAMAQEGVPNLVALPEDYVRFVPLPEGGTQPRLRRHTDGTTAVLFFRGEGDSGDLFLVRSGDECETFGEPVRVNGVPGEVPLVAGLHLGAFVLGPDGLASVVWVREGESRRLILAREQADGTFEWQDLGTGSGMALGAAVAVDDEGRTFVFHGADDPSAESSASTGWTARIWMRRAEAGGAFSEPVPAGRPLGCSKECPMDAVFDPWSRNVYAFYRTYYAPREESPIRIRNLMLLSTKDGGETFKAKLADNWRYQPPLTVLARLDLDPRRETVRAAWEGSGSVFAAAVRRNYATVALPFDVPDGQGFRRSSSSSSTGKFGDWILSWVERPADDPGAPTRLRWRVFDFEKRTTLGGDLGPECGNSVPAVLARDAGGYTIVY
jgi:hypothetical protein